MLLLNLNSTIKPIKHRGDRGSKNHREPTLDKIDFLLT